MMNAPWSAWVLCGALIGWPLLSLACAAFARVSHSRVRAAAQALLSDSKWTTEERDVVTSHLRDALDWKAGWWAAVAAPIFMAAAPFVIAVQTFREPRDRSESSDKQRYLEARFGSKLLRYDLFQTEEFNALTDWTLATEFVRPQIIVSVLLSAPLLIAASAISGIACGVAWLASRLEGRSGIWSRAIVSATHFFRAL